MKYFWIIAIIALIGIGVYAFMYSGSETDVPGGSDDTMQEDQTDQNQNGDDTDDQSGDEQASGSRAIGSSAGGSDITARSFGSGDTEILFVGGIHGGYSWNTALLSHELIDHLEQNPGTVPENVRVTVIPVLNPDGLEEVVGTTGRFSAGDVSGNTTPGRFNANGVDLNRNFDCNWQSSGTWQSQTVDAGSEPFSEPEARALRDYVQQNDPAAVVAFYSAAGGVYTSSCNGGTVLPESTQLMNTYANASSYPAAGTFDAYEVTGDMTDWLAKTGVPAISVILQTHDSAEWSTNRPGIEALLQHYAN